MKKVQKGMVIYTFSRKHEPAVKIKPKEKVLLETEDALGGQVRNEKNSLENLDWTKVDGATGPVYIEGAVPGDTLVVEILDVKVEDKGVMVIIPKSGILGDKTFSPYTKIIKIKNGYIQFDDVKVKARPMIGTIGVAPESGEISTGSLGKHGGNMDFKEVTAHTRLYLPIFTEGALFAAGDIHAAQADGELCVSSVEVAGEILLKFDVIKKKQPEWPILETEDKYALLACGETLDEAAKCASEAAVSAFMRKYGWSFEKAYMFGSLAANLEINQVVDPKKGVRAVISKDFMELNHLLI
ncbi:MAG: acetamidase/formamidase family protein [Candidatus Bathyarchaeia archaeon]|nr:MAG: formamidase [Candidatus Bathyarchaeota archaeon]